MSKMMMVRRIPMTSPTCDWFCTVCTLVLVVVVLSVVVMTGWDAWLLDEGALLVDSVLNGFSRYSSVNKATLDKEGLPCCYLIQRISH